MWTTPATCGYLLRSPKSMYITCDGVLSFLLKPLSYALICTYCASFSTQLDLVRSFDTSSFWVTVTRPNSLLQMRQWLWSASLPLHSRVKHAIIKKCIGVFMTDKSVHFRLATKSSTFITSRCSLTCFELKSHVRSSVVIRFSIAFHDLVCARV